MVIFRITSTITAVHVTHYATGDLLFITLQIQDINQHLRLMQTEEKDHQKRISNTMRTIEDLKSELAKVADQPDVTPKINDINDELRRIQVDRARMEGERSDLCRERDNICAETKSEIRASSPIKIMNGVEQSIVQQHRMELIDYVQFIFVQFCGPLACKIKRHLFCCNFATIHFQPTIKHTFFFFF